MPSIGIPHRRRALAATLLTDNRVVAIGDGFGLRLLAARSRLEEQRLIEKFGDTYGADQPGIGWSMPRLSRSWSQACR